MNHEYRKITTHSMFYTGADGYLGFQNDEDEKRDTWHFEGAHLHREEVEQVKRIKIGNDVWLGHNVLITNYANIGNGVIVGAGAIITKEVPDYAVVVGVPARIIRYRYMPEQIAALNEIAWWDWSDDEIRKNYDDFFLPVEVFIEKHQKKN